MDLANFFQLNNRVAIAFSGGCDSAFLLYAAKKYAAEVKAYYVKSQFQPQFELEDAKRLAEELSADLKVLEVDVLSDDIIVSNPRNRCYYCKKKIFTAICNEAKKDGFEVIIDGTNASDDISDRPGFKALTEMNVKSPLKDCGITKDMVRELSKQAGLFTWDKPAYACLATRIPNGSAITAEKLERTEKAERYLSSCGLTDFRVRDLDDNAKIQIKDEQLSIFLEHKSDICAELKKYYKSVLLDLEGR